MVRNVYPKIRRRVTVHVLALVVLLGSPTFLVAGGDDWRFRVKSTTIRGAIPVIELIPLENNTMFPATCDVITVRAVYKARSWWFGPRNATPRAEHDRAVEFLLAAAEKKSEISFGIIFENFKPACEVETRAIDLFMDQRGTAVYAHF